MPPNLLYAANVKSPKLTTVLPALLLDLTTNGATANPSKDSSRATYKPVGQLPVAKDKVSFQGQETINVSAVMVQSGCELVGWFAKESITRPSPPLYDPTRITFTDQVPVLRTLNFNTSPGSTEAEVV